MTIKQLKIAAQIIFMNRQIKLNTRNFKIIPYNEENYKLDIVRYFLGSVTGNGIIENPTFHILHVVIS